MLKNKGEGGGWEGNEENFEQGTKEVGIRSSYLPYHTPYEIIYTSTSHGVSD